MQKYLDMPDDLLTFFLMDCAFGSKSSLTYIKLDQIPMGDLRRGIEERIRKHYKFYIRKMGGLSNLMEHSAHVIPIDNGAWSNESIDEAKFHTPSPLPAVVFKEEEQSFYDCPMSSRNEEENSINSTLTLLHEANMTLLCDTNVNDCFLDEMTSTRPLFASSPDSSKSSFTLSLLSDWSYGKENIPPMDEEIPCGQKKEETPHDAELYGKRYFQDIANAPITKRCKKAKRLPLARKLDFSLLD